VKLTKWAEVPSDDGQVKLTKWAEVPSDGGQLRLTTQGRPIEDGQVRFIAAILDGTTSTPNEPKATERCRQGWPSTNHTHEESKFIG
jgi:hypothetical protein